MIGSAPAFSGDIRALEPEHWSNWLPLWIAYNAHGPDGGPPPPEPVTKVIWHRLLDDHTQMQGFIAELHGAAIGIVHLAFHPIPKGSGTACRLCDLVVDGTQRQQGVGTALVEKVYAVARERGADHVYWHVKQENEIAKRLYDKVAAPSGHLVYRKSL